MDKVEILLHIAKNIILKLRMSQIETDRNKAQAQLNEAINILQAHVVLAENGDE